MSVSKTVDVTYRRTTHDGVYLWHMNTALAGDASGGSSTINARMFKSITTESPLHITISELWMHISAAGNFYLNIDPTDWPESFQGLTDPIHISQETIANAGGGGVKLTDQLTVPIYLGKPRLSADVNLQSVGSNPGAGVNHVFTIRGYATEWALIGGLFLPPLPEERPA